MPGDDDRDERDRELSQMVLARIRQRMAEDGTGNNAMARTLKLPNPGTLSRLLTRERKSVSLGLAWRVMTYLGFTWEELLVKRPDHRLFSNAGAAEVRREIEAGRTDASPPDNVRPSAAGSPAQSTRPKRMGPPRPHALNVRPPDGK